MTSRSGAPRSEPWPSSGRPRKQKRLGRDAGRHARGRHDEHSVRPGGPTFLARTTDRLVLGLPGNPLAAVLGLLAVGGPLLEAWTGHGTGSTTVTVVVGRVGRARCTRLVPVAVRDGVATPTAHAGSAMLRGLAAADGVLVVPPSGVPAGVPAEALLLPWPT